MAPSRSAEDHAAGRAPAGAPAAGRRGWLPAWLWGDVALALLGAMAALAVAAALGFPKLAEPGSDNDSLMRLVQVRDLIAGQNWFDLHQYRMGPPGGFVMHWSRLVDAPIAGLILLLRPVLGAAGAESAAALAWPTVLLACSLFFLLRSAAAIGGEAARFPALVLGGTALHFTGIFTPGAFDHHNLQLTLVLAMTAGLTSGRSLAAAAAAGAAAAASIAVGMETIPYLAAAGLSVAALFWLRGAEETPSAAGFGAGLAAGAALCLALTVRPSAWSVTACDAFSGAQAGSAVLAGLGLAAVAVLAGRRGRTTRAVALTALAAASAAFLLAAYPQCLADPYADVPARLRDYWLDWVSEAQSLRSVLASEPAEAAAYYATPLIALGLMLGRLARLAGWREALPVAVLLAAAFAVSVWQVRGSTFSLALAVVPLSAWVGRLRARAEGGSAGAVLKMAGGWLVSFNVVWGVAALLVFGSQGPDDAAAEADACRGAGAFAALAALPQGTVLAVSNHGAPILAETAHRVLAGPYHRNIEGNLATIDAMVGTPDEALAIVRRYGVDYLAVCPGNPETQILTARAPGGLLDRIQQGEATGWLEPLTSPEQAPLRLFRIID